MGLVMRQFGPVHCTPHVAQSCAQHVSHQSTSRGLQALVPRCQGSQHGHRNISDAWQPCKTPQHDEHWQQHWEARNVWDFSMHNCSLSVSEELWEAQTVVHWLRFKPAVEPRLLSVHRYPGHLVHGCAVGSIRHCTGVGHEEL